MIAKVFLFNILPLEEDTSLRFQEVGCNELH